MAWYWPLVGGFVLVILYRSFRPGNSLRIGSNSGVAVGGDVHGSITQQISAPPVAPQKSPPDRVAWAIGIIAALISAVQLVLQVWGPK